MSTLSNPRSTPVTLHSATGEDHMSEKLYNVWADLKDGKGVRKINAKPLSREKALAEVNRLVYGRCKAQRAYALEASNAVRQGVPISA